MFGKLEAKDCFQRQFQTKYLTQVVVFFVKQGKTGKVQFSFSSSSELVLAKLSFWGKDWILSYNSMKFRDFLDIS